MSVTLVQEPFQMSMFSAAASPARISPLLEDELALLEREAASSTSSRELSTRLSLLGWSSKTSPASLAQEGDGTWVPSSGRFLNSGMGGPTGYWTLNTSEFPKDAAVCSLSDVLEDEREIAPRYYLSPKACSGILRRAEKRGKTLPPALEAALRAQVSICPDEAEKTTGTL